VTEGEGLRTAVLEDSRRAMSAFSLATSDFSARSDYPAYPPAVQSALPAQLDAITTLAKAGDWQAVRQRLSNQVNSNAISNVALVERSITRSARSRPKPCAKLSAYNVWFSWWCR